MHHHHIFCRRSRDVVAIARLFHVHGAARGALTPQTRQGSAPKVPRAKPAFPKSKVPLLFLSHACLDPPYLETLFDKHPRRLLKECQAS